MPRKKAAAFRRTPAGSGFGRTATLPAGAHRKDILWRALLIVLAVALTYADTLSIPFLFDDEGSIVRNASIRQLDASLAPPRDTPVAGRPLVNLSFALNYRAGGLDLRGYHVVNIAIHVAAALVLFGIVRRTLLLPKLADRFGRASANLALACALIWALHPLQTEAVNYLSERTESLMGLFYLLTLYLGIRGRPVAAVASCAAGMACKESMVTAPVMVLLYDRVFVFDSVRDAFRARRRLYAGLAASWLVLAALMFSVPRTSVGFAAGTSAWMYLLNQAELVPRYLWLTLWPRALVLDYGMPRALTLADVLVPAAIVIVLVVATLAALRRSPMVGFLGAWLFITLAPTSSIVPIATEVGAERRMYLPLAAVVVLGVGFIYFRCRAGLDGPPGGPQGSALRQKTFLIAAAAVCLLLAAGTVARNREYESRLTMARTIVDRRPHGRAHFLLANELIAAGQRDEAMAQLRLSARDYPGAHFALGTELLGEGRIDEGIAELQTFLRALPAHPNAAPARDMLGQAYLGQRKFAEAAEQFRYLHDKMPTYRGANNDVLRNLGYALTASGRLLEAVPVLERAVESNPEDGAARDLLSRVRAAAAAPPLTNRLN
jgi:tetratricopeptide (TPR) repeat protein